MNEFPPEVRNGGKWFERAVSFGGLLLALLSLLLAVGGPVLVWLVGVERRMTAFDERQQTVLRSLVVGDQRDSVERQERETQMHELLNQITQLRIENARLHNTVPPK